MEGLLVVSFYRLHTLPHLVGITGIYCPAASTLLMSAEMRQSKKTTMKILTQVFGVEVGSGVDFVITWLPRESFSCILCGEGMNVQTPACK